MTGGKAGKVFIPFIVSFPTLCTVTEIPVQSNCHHAAVYVLMQLKEK